MRVSSPFSLMSVVGIRKFANPNFGQPGQPPLLVGVSCAGELRAEGTEKSRITLKAADPEKGWAHVLLADGQGQFEYCTFEGARGAKHDSQPDGSPTPKLDEIYDGQTRWGGAVLAHGNLDRSERSEPEPPGLRPSVPLGPGPRCGALRNMQ